MTGIGMFVNKNLTKQASFIYISRTTYQFMYLSMKKNAKTTTKITFKPAGDRVLVKPEAQEAEKTASGIYIPDTAKKEKSETGVIIAVGPGKRGDDGKLQAVSFKVGDKVMFSSYMPDKVTINDEEYFVISESNILGTF